MPIYEYQAIDGKRSCNHCKGGFELLQDINEQEINKCPQCGAPVKKVISWCHSAVMETSDEYRRVTDRIKEYERQGMWSHAAELADKHSEKIKDKELKMRALDNYQKAGYDVDTLSKHANLESE